MVSETVIILGINAISAILILALAALGLAIIFGLMGVINLAHGAFFMLGAYTVWLFTTELGISFWLGFVLAPFVVAIIGYMVERVLISYLYERILDTILATWGVAIVAREGVKLIFGVDNKQVTNPLGGGIEIAGITYPTYRLFLILFSILVLSSVFIFIQRTQFGVRLQAVIQDAETASLLGLNQARIYQFGFAFGAALAGLAGASVTPIVSVNPGMGLTFLVQSFLAVILGGTGQLVGILPGSTVIAGGSNLMTYSLSPVVGQMIVFALAVVIIVFRPTGILGGDEV